MVAESEQRPHIVYAEAQANDAIATVFMFQNYTDAHRQWAACHTWQRPWRIATLGRHCTPDAALVDPNE